MLLKTPNRQTTYYKITNEKEIHNGLQYHSGLIIDPEKFNNDTKDACVGGGIYFTTKELLHEFLFHGCWIRPVIIPEDANVILDPQGDRYKADKLIFQDRQPFDYYFDKLFDIKTFPKSGYKILVLEHKDQFNTWFDKDYFDYKNCSWKLARFYKHTFNDWYDNDKYNHKQDGWALAHYCHNNFSKWFDKETFNYKNHSWVLPQHCSKYYKMWFDKDYYNYQNSYALLKYSLKHFDTWFSKDSFNYEESSWALSYFCPEKFDLWFDKNKYNYEKDGWAIERFCSKYI